jgi:hypothetical protein
VRKAAREGIFWIFGKFFEKREKKMKKVLDRGEHRCYINEAVRRGRAAEKRPAGKKVLDKRACGMVI